jgi:Putative auto-transporter adhesin, head GIN domain
MIMRKLFVLVGLLAFNVFSYAQQIINDPNTEKRNVTGFHSIDVSGGIDLYLSQGQEAVAVSAAEPKFREKIKTEVKNGVLKIWYEYNSNMRLDWSNRKLKAYVSFKELDMLKGSGGSDIKVAGTLNVPDLSLDISGGSDFEGKVNLNELRVDASGGSDVDISGTAKNLHIDASGGSDFKGYELVTDNCTVDASGGSDVYITVNKELTAESSGGSDIHYKGNGMIKNVKSSNSSIKKVGK